MRLATLFCFTFLLTHGFAWAQPRVEEIGRTVFSLDQGPGREDNEVAAFSLGALAMDFPGKWRFAAPQKMSDGAVVWLGQGPDGQRVALSVYLARDAKYSAKVPDKNWDANVATVTDAVSRAVTEFGTIIRPVTESRTTEANVVISAAAESSMLFARNYLVQYVLGSGRLNWLVKIDFEGRGRVAEVVDGLDRIVRTHRWGWGLYPEQASVFSEGGLDRPDLRTIVRPANRSQVRDAWGPDFASLPRLGVLLILVNNKTREAHVSVSRQTVRLKLPDGRELKPLEPSEMVAWLEEARGASPERFGKASIFEHQSDQRRSDYEKGILTVSMGKPRGTVLAFRFPPEVASGTFSARYVLDLGADGQVSVEQEVPLNLRPQ